MRAAGAFGLGTAASALVPRPLHRSDRAPARLLRLSMALLAVALVLAALAPAASPCWSPRNWRPASPRGVALPAIYASAAAVAPRGRESRTIGVVLTGWTLEHGGGRVAVGACSPISSTGGRLCHRSRRCVAALPHWRSPAVDLRERSAGPAAPLPFAALGVPGVPPLLSPAAPSWPPSTASMAIWATTFTQGSAQPVSANGLVALVYGIGFGGAALLDGIADRLGARRLLPSAFVAVAAVYAGWRLPGAASRRSLPSSSSGGSPTISGSIS